MGRSHDIGEIGDNRDNSDSLALAPYATVSRAWQQRVEATTFAHITLTPARLASPLAAQALTPDRARRFVRSIHIDLLLPPYDEQARGRREDKADRAINDGVFTDAVRRLFGLLAGSQRVQQQRAGVDADYRPKIRLSMKARCISDTEDLEARVYRWHVYGSTHTDIFEARYASSYLDLRLTTGKSVREEVEALPELHCIKEFYVEATESSGPSPFALRTIAPRVLCLMASRMPGLEYVHWQLSDNEKRDTALRKRLRDDFAHNLRTLPSSLQRFNLLYDRRQPLDHSFQTPSVLDETDRGNNDKLSLALCKLSQRLATFSLIADVGPEVLWPSVPMQDDGPLWPRMRDYSIYHSVIASSGQWRFQRPGPDSDDDSDDDGVEPFLDDDAAPGDEKEDPFRRNLDPDVANALLLAAARAVRLMPALRTMRFVLGRPPGAGGLEVEYRVDGGDGGGTAELVFEGHPVFHPDEEVVHIWREAAGEHAGTGLAVVVRDPWAAMIVSGN